MLSIVQLNLSVDPKLVSALNSLEALYVLIAHLSCFEAAKLNPVSEIAAKKSISGARH